MNSRLLLSTPALKRVAPTSARALQRAASTATPPQECDIAIVGGGPAGLAFATALGASEVVGQTSRVVLVEASDLSKIEDWAMPSDAYSNRVSSITNSSRRFLQHIGAWEYLEASRTSPVEEMQVWDGISGARIVFNAADMDLPSSEGMACLVENLNLQRAFMRRLSTSKTVELVDKVKVTSIARESPEGGSWPLVTLSDGRVLRPRLLVGADGLNSPVRTYAGISTYGWLYETHALVATLQHRPRSASQLANTTAYQRFLPTGPIAFLPLSDTHSSLVWSTKPAIAAALKATNPQVLAHMVNAAFRLPEPSVRYLHDRILEAQAAGTPMEPSSVLDEIRWRESSHGIDVNSAYSSVAGHTGGIASLDTEQVPPAVESIQHGTLASFPLRYNHADAYIGDGEGARSVLLGDAAHSIHPLAGQGLNLGLADAEALARCIDHALLRGGDIGSLTALQPYARERYFENHKVMSAVDKLHKIYSMKSPLAVWARSTGLEVINELDTVKAAIMLQAGGARQSGTDTSLWDVAGSTVANVSHFMNTATLVGRSVGDSVASGMRSVLSNGMKR